MPNESKSVIVDVVDVVDVVDKERLNHLAAEVIVASFNGLLVVLE